MKANKKGTAGRAVPRKDGQKMTSQLTHLHLTTNSADEDSNITISARELHEALQIQTRFNDWFPRICEYGFQDGEDFYSILSKTQESGRPSTDYAITIDMAKQICMLQRSDAGRQYRAYLIQVEKDWNSPEKVMARALSIANKTISSLNVQIEEKNVQIDEMKPKALFADAVSSSKTSILIGQLAKLISQNGHQIGQNRLFDWLRTNGYLSTRKGSDWNMPIQRYIEMGLFEIKESTHLDGNGVNVTTKTPKVTGKGQVYFINKFKEMESQA